MAVFATSSGDMLNFSASSFMASMPARSAKPVSVGPGHRQDTETLVCFSSVAIALLNDSTNALVAA